MNRTELLSSGSQAALVATHAENAGLSYSGSGSKAGAETLERLRQAGMVDESNPAERGGGDSEPSEDEINSLLQKYGKDWGNKPEADKDKFLSAWEMTMKAKLGVGSAKKWCQDNNLTAELHGEVFRRLAARRKDEKMTTAEKAQGLTGEFLIFREVLPRLLNNKELVDQRTILAPQQGGQNATKP